MHQTVANYYLPICFQAINGASPTMSGVYMLPSILGQLFAAVLAGKLVGVVGRYLPFALASATLTALGYGLSSMFSPNTSTAEVIHFRLIDDVGGQTDSNCSGSFTRSCLASAGELPYALLEA